jgi:ABC-type dipeptide/oligopeptide/nickel transport system permease subunit
MVDDSTTVNASGVEPVQPVLAGAARRVLVPPRQSAGLGVWRRFVRNRLALIASVVLLLICGIALAAPLVIDRERTLEQARRDTFAPPSADAWFGRDELGRDAFARAVYGARISLAVGIVSALISTMIGVILGMAAGYLGGWVDSLIDRFTELILTIPFLLLLILAAAVMRPSVLSIILILGLFDWPVLARLVRGEFLSMRNREFVEAARALGCTSPRIIVRHILPNAVAPIIVSLTLLVAIHITSEAAISFLGLGIQPPTPSWGNMLTEAQRYIISSPFLAIFPGLLILITVLCFNLLGDGLRDAFDPRQKR